MAMFHVFGTLNINKKNTIVNNGTAKGADKLGALFATNHEIPVLDFKPDWNSLGKKAGILRNEEMSNKSDIVVAFWDGFSVGTSHMIDYSQKHGKIVFVFNYEGVLQHVYNYENVQNRN